ncbi:MAG: ribbon-helix-helix domain-containing protein [Deltaproteobacteria bacterium]|nr:ribbon-helix-helix domain-containing protein [Deltaproteobacteria bacterium]
MRNRTFHTSINLLIEAGLYQRLRWAAKQTKTSMSKIVREGIKLILAQIEKEIDIVMGGHK